MAGEQTAEPVDDGFELPLVKLTKEDVYGALFVHSRTDETYRDSLLKFQTWIMNFAEEQIRPLRETGDFSEAELEKIRQKSSVISPITLTLYLHWLQMEQFMKLPDSEKERYLLEKLPDRFKARFKGNASCRKAREILPEEEKPSEEEEDSEGHREMGKVSFAEFLKEFGEEVKRKLAEKGG